MVRYQIIQHAGTSQDIVCILRHVIPLSNGIKAPSKYTLITNGFTDNIHYSFLCIGKYKIYSPNPSRVQQREHKVRIILIITHFRMPVGFSENFLRLEKCLPPHYPKTLSLYTNKFSTTTKRSVLT